MTIRDASTPDDTPTAFGDLLTTAQVADMLGVAPSTVRVMVSCDHLLTPLRAGHDNFFRRAEVERLRDHRRRPRR